MKIVHKNLNLKTTAVMQLGIYKEPFKQRFYKEPFLKIWRTIKSAFKYPHWGFVAPEPNVSINC